MDSERTTVPEHERWNWQRVYEIAETMRYRGKEFLSDSETAFVEEHPEIELLAKDKAEGKGARAREKPLKLNEILSN